VEIDLVGIADAEGKVPLSKTVSWLRELYESPLFAETNWELMDDATTTDKLGCTGLSHTVISMYKYAMPFYTKKLGFLPSTLLEGKHNDEWCQGAQEVYNMGQMLLKDIHEDLMGDSLQVFQELVGSLYGYPQKPLPSKTLAMMITQDWKSQRDHEVCDIIRTFQGAVLSKWTCHQEKDGCKDRMDAARWVGVSRGQALSTNTWRTRGQFPAGYYNMLKPSELEDMRTKACPRLQTWSNYGPFPVQTANEAEDWWA
jgi:hypothetical protein